MLLVLRKKWFDQGTNFFPHNPPLTLSFYPFGCSHDPIDIGFGARKEIVPDGII